MIGSFEKTLRAVKRFARMDAARFRLRDSLRAQALGSMLENYPSSFIEAGEIHYPLWAGLRRQAPSPKSLRLIFLADTALQTVGKRGRLYGPGARLTLLYVLHPKLRQPKHEALMAARALIYSKLIIKEELADHGGAFTHLPDEMRCIRTVNRLSLNDCRLLFPKVCHAGSNQAHQIVADHLGGSKFHRSWEQ